MTSFEWGDTLGRREGGTPFLCYSPRRTNVAEMLDDAARWRSHTHVVQGGRRISFGELFEAVDRVCAQLAAMGVERGERVLLLASNSPEWLTTFWAVVKLGGIVSLGNGWWSPEEMAHAASVVQPAAILMDDRAERLFGAAASGFRIIHVDEVRRWSSTGGTRLDETAVTEMAGLGQDEDDPAVILFTAGTTAAPKAVVLSHRSVIANIHNLLVMSGRLPHNVPVDREPTVSLQSGPLFHIGGLQSLLLALLGGNTLVFLEGRFDGEQVLDLIERERVSWWAAVPTMASRVVDHPTLPGRDLSSVKSVSMGGAPIQPALLDRLREVFPNAARGLSTVYGMTETGGTIAAASGRTMAEHPTTAGRPLPVVDIRIDDPTSDGEGEIVVRTPGQMSGYWSVEAPEIIDEDGFVHTGDLGRLEDGLLFVTGRSKDLIIRGGENIAPSRVEAVLLDHAAVVDAAVIGLPDEDLGERVAAVVQLAPGEAATEQELMAYAVERLPRPSVPSEWSLVTSPLPMSDTGKTDKRKLREGWATRGEATR